MSSKESYSETLQRIQLKEDQIILLDVKLNSSTITRSVDAYQLDNKLMLAIEPLFDALKIRYAITQDTLTIWQDEKENNFTLSNQPGNSENFLWASDNFYFFIELALVEKLFPVKIEIIYNNLELKITTGKEEMIFPVQKLAQQARQRNLNRFTADQYDFEQNQIPITIADQYRLFTVPHGRVLIAAETDRNDTSINGSVQLVSDLLYHSANLTLSDNSNSDFAARLVLSRYKTEPNKPILGLYDQYQLGDISSITNGISTNTSGGVGISFNKLGNNNFRQTNQAINLQEIAPPGWEAELFRNNIFLAATTVPDDGLLNFDDIEVEYGINNYEIKLYGPFGETQIRKKTLDLTQNALQKGQFTHGVYALDRNHRLINDQSTEPYTFTDYGATFDYGVTDYWQIGFGIAGVKDNQQFYNFSNAVSLPGLLIENDLSIDQESNYSQITSVKGSLFERDAYSFVFQSSDNFVSDRTQTTGQSSILSGSYSKPTDFANLNFSATYSEDDFSKRTSFSNRISKNVGSLIVRHDLDYTDISSIQINQRLISGVLGLSGMLPYKFRISANLRYSPEEEDKVSKSSSLLLQRNMRDPWNGFHSFNISYLPLAESTSAWRLSHRAAWQAEEFQLNVSTNFDEQNKWSFQLGIQLFLGYDYRNNKFLFNQNIQSNTATLDIHTYLDRQINGIHDPLDYNLSDVEFYGNPEWESMKSGQNGRTILPGVSAATPFSFGAKWKQGSNTINNDYVVYTHPGAYIDVNMPFVLSTDLIGFVMRTQGEQEVGIQNIKIELSNTENIVLQSIETDLDGYYEFNGLSPGQYKIQVTESTLQDQGYTSETIGFSILTGGQGGFSELPAIRLRRISGPSDREAQSISSYNLNSKNSEPVIWNDDPKVMQNYFTLPTKNKVKAKYSLTQNKQDDELPLQENQGETTLGTPSTEELVVESSNDKAPSQYVLFKNKPNAVGLPTLSVGNAIETKTSVNEKNINSDNVLREENIPTNSSLAQAYAAPFLSTELIEDSESKTILIGEYVIQLGAYTEQSIAQEMIQRLATDKLLKQNFSIIKDDVNNLLRLTYGRFESVTSASVFANKNIKQSQPYFVRKLKSDSANNSNIEVPDASAKSSENNNIGWVVQFYASEAPLSLASLPGRYSVIKNTRTATKQTAGNKILYCLISQTYTNKATATQALVESGLNGWVTSSSNFSNISKL